MTVKRRSSLYTPTRGAGEDQRAKWKAALAAHNRGQRTTRWQRKPAPYRPGMARKQPPGAS